MPRHPNKHIDEAVRDVQAKGWRLIKAGPRAHVWGQLLCPRENREGCIIRVFSTPRNPQNHAKRIVAEADRCPHQDRTP